LAERIPIILRLPDRLPAIGQQLIEATDGMVINAPEQIVEVIEGIGIVQLAREPSASGTKQFDWKDGL